MSQSLINPQDSLKRQNEKLLKVTESLMQRIEQGTETSGIAYAQFERAVLLEEEIRSRTSDLERALDLLNESNARLAQANIETEAVRTNLANGIEAVSEGFALFNEQDQLVMSNSRFGKHLKDIYSLIKPGINYSEYVHMVSSSPFLILPKGQTPEQWANRRLARHKEKHVNFNARLIDQRWLQVSEQSTSDGGTVVLQTDVTDMIRLERKERDRLLGDQANLTHATLEHLNQGICIFNNRNELVVWNKLAGEMLSIPHGRFIIGTPFRAIFEKLKNEFDFQDIKMPEIIWSWVSNQSTRVPLSFECSTSDNRILSAFTQNMPDSGFVISFTDVTVERAASLMISKANESLEKRVVERTMELEDALAEAERANASKSRFVAAASHDLLQPLSAAKLYVSSLENQISIPKAQERLAKANNALLSVENILGALLDISKLDIGKVAVHKSEVPLDLLLGQLKDELLPIANQKGLELKILPTSVVVYSDATFLRRIAQNLISNAIRYTDTGKVLVGARRSKKNISLEVWDTGPGIPDSQQELVFQEFHRLNAASQSSDGMGLGLAIVERACRLLEHPLQLDSTENKGTRFSVTLPRVIHPSIRVNRPKNNIIKKSNESFANTVVLLLENDDELRNALSITLENWGVSTIACASQSEAEKLFDEIEIAPDAIIADYQLDHGLLGTDALALFNQRFGPISSCIITADRSNALLDLCQGMGAELFFKPLDPRDIRRFLKDCRAL